MREPLTRFPKRPTGPAELRRTLAECQAMLANPRLSPEMRQALVDRVGQLRADLEADAQRRARKAAEAPPPRPGRRRDRTPSVG